MTIGCVSLHFCVGWFESVAFDLRITVWDNSYELP